MRESLEMLQFIALSLTGLAAIAALGGVRWSGGAVAMRPSRSFTSQTDSCKAS